MLLLFAMVRRDLKARLKDRSAIIVGLVAPIALILVFNMIGSGPQRSALKIGFAAPGNTPAAAIVADGPLAQLQKDGMLKVTNFADRAALEQAIKDDKVTAGLVVAAAETPTAAPQPDRPAGAPPLTSYEVIRGKDAVVSGAVLDAVATRTARSIDTVNAAVGTELTLGSKNSDPAAIAQAVQASIQAENPEVAISDRGASSGGLSDKAMISAGMASFFLFFTVQFGLLGLLEERTSGVLRRVLAAPVPAWMVLMAKVLVSFLLGVISLTALILTTRLAMGVQWGPSLGVALLVVCGVTAAVSTVILVAGLVRRTEQAAMAQTMVAMVLALLGGSFVSMARVGGVGAVLTRLTPNFWFSEGLVRISGERGWTGALLPAGYMLIFAVVVGLPGLLLAGRTVRP
jgi:ABC-2 type transport system permease protein